MTLLVEKLVTLPALQQPLVTIGASRADSMSARVIQNPLQMPDIRLQVICPGKSEKRSVLLYGGVHIDILEPESALLPELWRSTWLEYPIKGNAVGEYV